MNIRLAAHADLGPINDIYNHYVLTSTCTYQEEPETAADRLAWFEGTASATRRRWPRWTARCWAGRRSRRSRRGAAYRHSVEVSVYIRHDSHRRGIGRALLIDIIERARAIGHHALIGGASADQVPSLGLQESLGFRRVAHFREVGYKFGLWLDVIYLELLL